MEDKMEGGGESKNEKEMKEKEKTWGQEEAEEEGGDKDNIPFVISFLFIVHNSIIQQCIVTLP
jgi:hypothetical protein